MAKGKSRAIGLLALIFGVLILLKPELLSFIVAIYFIVVGVSNLV